MIGLPLRFRCRPEVNLLTLVPGEVPVWPAKAIRTTAIRLLWSKSVRYDDGFAAGPGSEGRHDRVGRIREETHRAVGEKPITAAGVEAPEVVSVAGIVESPRAEMSAPGWAALDVVKPFRRADHHGVIGAPEALTIPAVNGIPPARLE